MLIWLAGTFVISYALGSIPFGLILAKLMGHGDLRKIGSGNIGATNALRTGNKALAILTLLLDAGKGALAVSLCHYYYGAEYAALAALFVVLGHIFPVWLQFKGGKGVATSFGVLFAMNWMLGIVVCLLWLAVFGLTRISSISSLISIGYSSVAAYVIDSYLSALLCLCIAALILFTHRGNILRLLEGNENRFLKKA
ncbi:MAG: glycerol-3-phosphate 1-O-acyltransferase PlsY [Alphaproteobacteria bacterium]|nr:glycerol-3-phosphate 1-O-acyltransferase PlsY [Alphaproteobacteria bacterium]